jgi:hypothetical protein
MSRFNQYWTLITPTATGQPKTQPQTTAQDLIQQVHPEASANSEVPNDRQLQRQLLTLATSGSSLDFKHPATLALRCYISHQTLAICRDLAKKFGQKHLFSASDLLGYVLDDNGKPQTPDSPYRIHSAQILKKFDPAKASLSTWTKQIIQTDDGLNQFLNQQGLRLISDWALLNHAASPGKIKRLLKDAPTLSQTLALVNAYHQVYRQARVLNGERGPCKAPSPQQCQTISDRLTPLSFSLPADQVLDELLNLAKLIREDDIATKRGAPPSQSLDIPDQQAQLEVLVSNSEPEIEDDIPWQLLSDRYQTELSACLHSAAKDVISTRHQRLKPQKAAIYPRAMALFYCEGWKMTEIAPHLGINDQSGITRLLELKQFRADLRHSVIACLQSKLSEILSPHMPPAQLANLDQRLDENLGIQLDQLIKAEKDEAQTPSQHITDRSRLAQVISQVLQELYPKP